MLSKRDLPRRAALACLMALVLAALFHSWRPVIASAAASQVFPHVEPVTVTMSEFFNAAIRFDPHCADESERLAAKLDAAIEVSTWRPIAGFGMSPSAFESWAAAEGPLGMRCRLTYESGGLDVGHNDWAAVWRGAVEAPLSCISQIIQQGAVGPAEETMRAAEFRVAVAEAGAAAAALDILRKAEILAIRGNVTGAVQAYGELSLLMGLPSHEIRPVVITGDGPARLAELIERALQAAPGVLLHEWLARDPDLVEAEARQAAAGCVNSLLDAITLFAGFEWTQPSAGPRWHMGATLAVTPGMVSKSTRPVPNDQATLLQRRVDALEARSTAEFIRALGQLQSVWAELSVLSESGNPGAARLDAQRRVETAGITFLAKLGVFVWKSQ